MKTSQYAIITGATSGIGAEYARQLASAGWNLLLTGRRTDRLLQMKLAIEAAWDVQVTIVTADLSNAGDLCALIDAIRALPSVDLLINNAGFGNRANFYESDFARQCRMLDVHITATSRLVHAVVPLMLEQGRGGIINVASLAAFLPAALSYFYCASKAFLVAFTECLHVDLKRCGIRVQALCPGFTSTEFHDHEGTASENAIQNHSWLTMTTHQVVRCSLRMLGHGVICIPGFVNRLAYQLVRWMPRRVYYHLSAANHAAEPQPTLLPAGAI